MKAPEISLRKCLAEWSMTASSRSQLRWPATLPETFRPNRALRAAKRVDQQLGGEDLERPSPDTLDELYWRAAERLGRHVPLAEWPTRDLRRLPWVLFYTPEATSQERRPAHTGWLGENPRVVRDYGAWLSGGRRPRAALALLHEFLRVYPAGSDVFHGLRRILEDTILTGSETPSLRRWRQRCQAFRLLDREGDLAFAESLVSRGESVGRSLEEAGFDAGLATSDFLKSGLKKQLARLEEGLREDRDEPARLERMLVALEFRGELRFDELRSEIAESLLRPFLTREARAPTKEGILPFLMRHFGHPNLPAGKRNWRGIRNDLRTVALRWLVAQSLDAFFAVVKETALDRHWKYRERFWRAHFDAGVIDKAWFVLGARARAFVERQANRAELARGTLQGGEGGQSVLLLHIAGMPGMTVAEWSHSGACRAWLDGNRHAPRLYENEYQRYDSRPGQGLMHSADHSQSHHGSESGRWQDALAEWIRDYTGATVARDAYMPAGWSSSSPAWAKQSRAPAARSRARQTSKISEVDRRWAEWRSGRRG